MAATVSKPTKEVFCQSSLRLYKEGQTLRFDVYENSHDIKDIVYQLKDAYISSPQLNDFPLAFVLRQWVPSKSADLKTRELERKNFIKSCKYHAKMNGLNTIVSRIYWIDTSDKEIVNMAMEFYQCDAHSFLTNKDIRRAMRLTIFEGLNTLDTTNNVNVNQVASDISVSDVSNSSLSSSNLSLDSTLGRLISVRQDYFKVALKLLIIIADWCDKEGFIHLELLLKNIYVSSVYKNKYGKMVIDMKFGNFEMMKRLKIGKNGTFDCLKTDKLTRMETQRAIGTRAPEYYNGFVVGKSCHIWQIGLNIAGLKYFTKDFNNISFKYCVTNYLNDIDIEYDTFKLREKMEKTDYDSMKKSSLNRWHGVNSLAKLCLKRVKDGSERPLAYDLLYHSSFGAPSDCYLKLAKDQTFVANNGKEFPNGRIGIKLNILRDELRLDESNDKIVNRLNSIDFSIKDTKWSVSFVGLNTFCESMKENKDGKYYVDLWFDKEIENQKEYIPFRD